MSALTDYFTSLANKIRSKLGTQSTYTPDECVNAIDDVYDKGVADTKVGTATSGDVLSGKTFTNASTVGGNGSMANNGAVSASLNTSTTSYTIPQGYHNGSGNVSITTQAKTASSTLKVSNSTIYPDSGKVLSSVTIPAAFNGNPMTYFTQDGAGKWKFTPATGSGYVDLTCEVGSWYFFTAANASAVFSLSGITGVSDSKDLTVKRTIGSKTYSTTMGVVFKPNSTSVRITILNAGATKNFTGLVPIFFKIADS